MYKDSKGHPLTILTSRDDEILEILWHAKKSLNPVEITNLSNDLSLQDVQESIKKLLYRELLRITGMDFKETPKSRYYEPTVSACDYKAKGYVHKMCGITGEDFSIHQFLAALLNQRKGPQALDELEELKEIIELRRQELLEEGE